MSRPWTGRPRPSAALRQWCGEAGVRLAPVPATPGGPPDGLGILLDGEWTNSTSRARAASAVVLLHRARPSAVGRIAQPIFERSAELGLEVPPGAVRSTEDSTAALNAAHPGSPT